MSKPSFKNNQVSFTPTYCKQNTKGSYPSPLLLCLAFPGLTHELRKKMGLLSLACCHPSFFFLLTQNPLSQRRMTTTKEREKGKRIRTKREREIQKNKRGCTMEENDNTYSKMKEVKNGKSSRIVECHPTPPLYFPLTLLNLSWSSMWPLFFLLISLALDKYYVANPQTKMTRFCWWARPLASGQR